LQPEGLLVRCPTARRSLLVLPVPSVRPTRRLRLAASEQRRAVARWTCDFRDDRNGLSLGRGLDSLYRIEDVVADDLASISLTTAADAQLIVCRFLHPGNSASSPLGLGGIDAVWARHLFLAVVDRVGGTNVLTSTMPTFPFQAAACHHS